MLSNALLAEVKALEACKNIVVTGLGVYKGVVVEDGQVTGIAWERYVCEISDSLWHDHKNEQWDDLRYFTPAEVLRQIAQAVEALHSINIVHGDIHHHNVLLDSGRRAWLVDFDSASKMGEARPKKGSHFKDARKFESVRTYIDLYCLTKLEDDLIRFRTLAFEQSFINDIRDAPSRPSPQTPIDNVLKQHGDWHDIVTSWFRRIIVTLPDSVGDFVLTVKSFDAFGDSFELPTENEIKTADGLLLIGCEPVHASEEAAHKARDLLTSVHLSNPNLKMLAIGAGHSVVVEAFGGEVIEEFTDASVGVHALQLEGKFKALLDQGSAVPRGLTDSMALHAMHISIISKLPPGFTDLCKLENNQVQGIMSPQVESLDEVRTISLISHPEFSVHENIPLQYVEHLKAQGKLSEEEAVQASERTWVFDKGLEFGRLILGWITGGFTKRRHELTITPASAWAQADDDSSSTSV